MLFLPWSFISTIPRPLQESQDLKCLSTRSVAKAETSVFSSFYEEGGKPLQITGPNGP
jgi:hypothetical protein